MAGGFQVVVNTKRLDAALKRARKRAKDQRPAWKAIAEAHWIATQATFDANGARGGHKAWKPLSQYTLDRRRKGRDTAESAQILVDTGDMKSRATTRSNATEAAIGTNFERGLRHQYGEGVPQREWLFVTDDDLDEYAETVLDYLSAAFD